MRAEAVHFEYGPSDILAETRSDSPSENEPMTKSDVGIEVRDVLGRRGVILIEVKLSEEGWPRPEEDQDAIAVRDEDAGEHLAIRRQAASGTSQDA